MAVTEVVMIDNAGSIRADGHRDYTVVYRVRTNDVDDGPFTVRSAAGIPSRLSSYAIGNDSDTMAILKTKDARLVARTDTGFEWNVTCGYSSDFAGTGSQAGSVPSPETGFVNPLDEPCRWGGSLVQFTREFTQDSSGNTIKNTAGDPLVEPAITGDDSRLLIWAEKVFSAGNVLSIANAADKVNDGIFWGFAARTLKVQAITFDQFYVRNEPYVKAHLEVHVNQDTWDPDVLSAGYYELVGSKRVRIKDKLGAPVTSPWPLDIVGAALTDAAIASDSEYYQTVQIYDELDFGTLGFPTDFGAAY